MQYETVVIGSGQAGLSAGYYLAARGEPFVILDAADRVGGSWLNRWDSLALFTPAGHDGLPGVTFGGGYRFPSRDEMAAYLERYAERFRLPIRLGTHVDGLFREADGYRVTAGAESFLTRNVILATGFHRVSRTPAFAGELSPAIVQLHTADYRNPARCSSSARGTPEPRSASRWVGRTRSCSPGATSAAFRSRCAGGRASCCSRSSGGCGSTS